MELLQKAIESNSEQIYNIDDYDYRIKTILLALNTSLNILKSKSRRYNIRFKRQMFCYFVRKYTTLSTNSIGDIIFRTHSTVIHSCNRINDILSINSPADEVSKIKLCDSIIKNALIRNEPDMVRKTLKMSGYDDEKLFFLVKRLIDFSLMVNKD